MKTRKKSSSSNHKHSLKKIAKEPHKLNPYLVIYNDLLAEFVTKLNKFKTEFIQCNKWKPLNNKDFKILHINFQPILQNNMNNSTNPIQDIKKSLKPLQQSLSLLNKEYMTLHAISQVEYRKKYNLLHTLPPKKIHIFQSVYKNIIQIIQASKKIYKQKYIKKIVPHISKKVRFSSNVKVRYI
tara:strand:- start:648 stop:1196 length:549 start_codon:yes stop_codon:yes gene_type:complete